MKKCKKTYAIHTLAEKHTTFHLGKTRVHVSFTGGQTTKNGVNPATFTTSDPIVQLAIERSNDFAKGAIVLLAKYPMQGEVKIGKNPPESKKPESKKPELKKPESKKPELIIEAAAPEPSPIQEETSEQEVKAEEPEEVAEEEMTGDVKAEKDEDGESNLEVVEVSCKDVAKQYLEDHYGERPAPLRTWLDVQECASKYGIIFKSPTLE